MKYAILSDVHANRQALDAAIADARRMGAEAFVSLGDTVGYGPLPAEAIARVRETCEIALAGNHDDAVSGRIAARDFIELAADAVRRHRDALGADDLAWLRSLPYFAEIEGAVCTHGDLVDPPKFYYIEDEADAAANFNAGDFSLAFVGHTHRPAVFVIGASGNAHKIDPQDFALEDGKRFIVNVGSVGYPRESNGVCRSSYVLYDSTLKTVEFRFLPFSVASVLQRGRGPKRRGRLIAALGAVALAAIGACLWALSRPTVEQVTTVQQVTVTVETPKDDPALVVTNRTVAIATSGEAGSLPNVGAASCRTGTLRANLVLAKNSAPVNLRLRYRDANDKILSEQTIAVRRSLTKNLIDRSHPLPPDACEAELTVLKAKTNDTVCIVRFDPVCQ